MASAANRCCHNIEVAPDEPLDKRCRPVERPVSSDVGKTVVDLDELKIARRDKWDGERKAKLVDATLDAARREQLTGSRAVLPLMAVFG